MGVLLLPTIAAAIDRPDDPPPNDIELGLQKGSTGAAAWDKGCAIDGADERALQKEERDGRVSTCGRASCF